MQRTRRVALVMAVVGAVGLSACSSGSGSGGGGSSGTAAAPKVDQSLNKLGPDHGWSQTNVTLDASKLACQGTPSSETRGVTATSVKVGGLASLTSPAGTAFGGVEVGAKVRFAAANAAGGVAGRKIDYIGTRDDGSDPGTDNTQGQAVVQSDQVFAAVPVLTTSGDYADTFCKAVVPYFGWGTTPAYCGNVIGFGITGCQGQPAGFPHTVGTGTAAAVADLVPAGQSKTIALIGLDNEAAKQGAETVAGGFEAAGFKVVYNKGPVPLSGVTDATPIIQAVLRSDNGQPPAAVFMITQVADAVKLVSAFTAAGFKGLVITPFYDPRLATLGALQGMYASMQWAPGVSAQVPGVAQMLKDFQQYAPGTAVSLPAMSGYWAADMFLKGLQKVGRNLTVSSFLKVMNGSYTNYVAGALPETRWPLNHVTSAPCGALTRLADQKWTAQPLGCGAIAKATS